MVRNYHGDAKWIPGIVLKKLGPVTYSVDIGDERMVKRHIDLLHQNVHYTPESTSNRINEYYYLYEPVTPHQDAHPVLRTPSRSLEEERRYPQ